MFRHNSTIRIKEKLCNVCGKPRPIFSKGACQPCAHIRNALAAREKENEKEIALIAGLPELIDDADAIFSKYIRLRAADENGILLCYICDQPVHWKQAQLMHYIKRSNLYLRWDEKRNCRPGCKTCNEFKDGNLIEYARKLELELPGVTDILYEEALLPYKPTREEVKQIILEYSHRFKQIPHE